MDMFQLALLAIFLFLVWPKNKSDDSSIGRSPGSDNSDRGQKQQQKQLKQKQGGSPSHLKKQRGIDRINNNRYGK